MIRKIYTPLLTLAFSMSAVAQNIVINGGFEEYSSCPKAMSNFASDIDKLTTPTNGTTDYFNACGSGDVGVPKNFKGTQLAFEGQGYAGLHLYAPNDYREYVQLQLEQPLKRGKVYQVTMRMSLAEASVVAMQEVAVLFTGEQVMADINQNLSPPRLNRFNIKKYTYMTLESKGPLYDSEVWFELGMEFVAKGFEQYLVLGNFKNNQNSKKIRLETEENTPLQKAYYYVDDVQVAYLRNTEYELNKPFILDELSFEFNDFKLGEDAKKDIRKVYTHLRKHPKLKLMINGHTDDLGAESYNKYLSSRRAWTVAKYLQELGLDKNRITWEGHGDRKPKVADSSSKARKTNRRVEFVMTEVF